MSDPKKSAPDTGGLVICGPKLWEAARRLTTLLDRCDGDGPGLEGMVAGWDRRRVAIVRATLDLRILVESTTAKVRE